MLSFDSGSRSIPREHTQMPTPHRKAHGPLGIQTRNLAQVSEKYRTVFYLECWAIWTSGSCSWCVVHSSLHWWWWLSPGNKYILLKLLLILLLLLLLLYCYCYYLFHLTQTVLCKNWITHWENKPGCTWKFHFSFQWLRAAEKAEIPHGIKKDPNYFRNMSLKMKSSKPSSCFWQQQSDSTG